MTYNLLLIAAREFRQIASTRSFWLTLLILPLVFAVGPMASRFLEKREGQTVMVIDQTGGEIARTIERRITVNEQRAIMAALTRHVERRNIKFATPAPAWAQSGAWIDDAVVDQFIASGGQKAALAAIDTASQGGADGFEAPAQGFRVIKTPPALLSQTSQSIGQALEPYLRPGDDTKAKPIDYVLFIPVGFGASPQIGLWANGQPRASFVAMVQTELGKSLRAHFLAVNGLNIRISSEADAIMPAIKVTTPPEGKGRERVVIRSILPLASAYILLMSLMLSGSWMLQSTVEERSNKLLETVLACVTPNELMYGKLTGTVAIGLTMVATWVACGLFAAYATHGEIAALIRPALEPVSSLSSIATIIYFFVAGYIMISMVFLVLGIMSESMQEAQGFLTPVMLLIMMPFSLLLPAVLEGRASTAISVMSWVPLYSPFTILARLGGGVPAWEAIGSGLLLLAFIVGEIIFLGRVFRACLLNSGRRPSLKAIFQMMRTPG